MKTVCPHILPEAPPTSSSNSTVQGLGDPQRAPLATEIGLGKLTLLLCCAGDETRMSPGGQMLRKRGRVGQACSSRAPLNGDSYGNNDHSLPVSWVPAASWLPVRYYLTS